MSVLQTTYTEDPALGVPGTVFDGTSAPAISRTIEDGSGIAFGKAAFRGAGDHGCTATPTAGKLLGITVATTALGYVAGQNADTYQQYDNVEILPAGVILVSSSVAVAQNDAVYVTPAGVFTNVSTSNIALTGWVFDRTLAAAGIVPIAKR